VSHTSLQDYSKRMSQTGRPVSPHVMIYNFPIGAISSITNRVTGCALSVGLFGLAAAELTSGSALALTQAVGSVPIVAPVAKFSVAFPIVYHYLGALRHFAWDYQPELLETVDVERASYYLFGASGAISVVAMVM